MDRLIDADALEEFIADAYGYQAVDILGDIAKFPTVDAVEVVRCKDCKYGVWSEEEEMWQCVYSATFDDDIGEWFGFFDFNQAYHFCSCGERRTDG